MLRKAIKVATSFSLSLAMCFSLVNVEAKRIDKEEKNEAVAVGLRGSGTINLYPTYECNTKALTYIAASSVYTGDAAFIQEKGDAYQIKIGGAVGWIKKRDGIELIEMDDLKSPSFYKVNDDGELYHRISGDPKGMTFLSTVILGPAPDYLDEDEKYYSYDGNYFYTDYEEMIEDYRHDEFENAVNADEPYYNYYQYMPMHSITKIKGRELDKFLGTLGYDEKPESYDDLKNNESMLVDEGRTFIDVQDVYGTNAVLVYAIALNESGAGRSEYAIERNNFFGLGAIDANPDKANSFDSIEEGIETFASVHINWGYLDYNDWRYNGGHVGNKQSGINVAYASDPYWGEKAASYYYKIDKMNGMKDYGTYQIAMRSDVEKMDILKKASSSSKLIGQVSTVANMPYIVLDEEDRYYKVLLDFHIDKNKNVMKHDDSLWFEPYDFNENYGYIEKRNVMIVNEGNYDYEFPDKPADDEKNDEQDKNDEDKVEPAPEIKGTWVLNNGNYTYVLEDGSLLKGWRKIDGCWYFLDYETGIMKTGWVASGSDWYFLGGSGVMQESKWIDGKYYVMPDGKMATGVVKIGHEKHEFSANGIWIQKLSDEVIEPEQPEEKPGEELPQKPDEELPLNPEEETKPELKGTWVLNNGIYTYVLEDGSLLKGWHKIDGCWYFLDYETGVMKTGWVASGSDWYFMGGSGVMQESKWIDNQYYVLMDGRMATGLQMIDGMQYEFSLNGVLIQ